MTKNFGVVLPKMHSSYQMDVGWRKVSWNTLKQADFPSEIIQSFITKLKQPRANKIIFNQLVSERIFQKQSYSTQLQWLYPHNLALDNDWGRSIGGYPKCTCHGPRGNWISFFWITRAQNRPPHPVPCTLPCAPRLWDEAPSRDLQGRNRWRWGFYPCNAGILVHFLRALNMAISFFLN